MFPFFLQFINCHELPFWEGGTDTEGGGGGQRKGGLLQTELPDGRGVNSKSFYLQ